MGSAGLSCLGAIMRSLTVLLPLAFAGAVAVLVTGAAPRAALAQAQPAPADPAAPTPPAAGQVTVAGPFAAACASTNVNGRTFCLGTIYGALEMYSLLASLGAGGQEVLRGPARVICAPDQLQMETVRAQFIDWVAANPLRAELATGRALFFALLDIYPCPEPAPAALPAPRP